MTRVTVCLAAAILGVVDGAPLERVELSRGWKIKSLAPAASLDAGILGAAAALCAARNRGTRELAYGALRKALEQGGVYFES
jgi:hypothetical protein